MKEFTTDIFSVYDKTWGLLCAGTMENHNAMTISWGGMGTLWGKPVVTVYVRPNRHTYGFMENSEYFTVGFLKEEYRGAHGIMGSKSGRDMDKDREAGLTPCPAGETVMYAEAEATLLCRKIYCQDLDVSAFPEAVREKYYGSEPAHRMYIGEVVDIIRK